MPVVCPRHEAEASVYFGHISSFLYRCGLYDTTKSSKLSKDIVDVLK